MEYQHIVNNVKNGVIQTPAYIFDTDILRRKVSKITEILGETAKVCYAIKANPFIIRAVDDLVPKYEVCSPGELEICRNGHIPMKKVVFSGVNKTAASIRTAAQYGVGVMTIESLHQFDLIAECAASMKKEINIILRLTNGSQFGINEEDIEDLIARRGEFPYIHMLGVQYFTGTQKKKCDNIIHELDYAEEFCSRLMKKYNYKMEQFEYGTGLWVPYFTKDDFDHEFDDLTRIRDYFAAKNYPYEVILEMGRYPVASCGFFATKVEDCKTNKGANYCLIDAGIHQINYYGQNMALKTPIIDHYPMHPVADEVPKEWMMVGSLCTFNDVVARNFPVKDLQIGDYFIFHNIGAYSVTEGGYLFLSRDLPNIYFADEKNGIRMVRQGIPTHILSTPDMSGRRLDKPAEPKLQAAAVASAVPVSAAAPRLTTPTAERTVVPMTRQTAATTTATPGSATKTGAQPTSPSAAPRSPKRFVPETDVINEAKRDKATADQHAAARSASEKRPAAESRNTAPINRGTVTRSSSSRGNSPASAANSGRTSGASGQRSSRQSDSGRHSSNRRKKKSSVLPLLIGLVVILIIAGISAGIYFSRRVLPTLTVEAGTDIRTSDLMRYKGDQKKNGFALPYVDTSTPGDYKVDVYVSPFEYHSTVTVVDTKAPVLTLQDLEIWYGTELTVEDFITELTDATKVEAVFDTAPDVYTCSEQQIQITATDAAGNKTSQTATLTVNGVKDHIDVNLGAETLPTAAEFLADEYLAVLEGQGITADQISFAEDLSIDTSVPGEYNVWIMAGDQTLPSKIVICDAEAPMVMADDIYVTVGGTVAYKKNVRAYDNVDADDALTIEIIRDGVDLNTEGQYTYTANVTDASGNTGSDTATIFVLAADADVANIDEVNDLADAVLEKIIKEDMSQKQIIKAIYDWIRKNTRYTTYDQESDYVLGAYDGFTDHAGNCFTYAAMAKFLLTRAGIDNIDIVKVVPEGSTDIPTHFWNLVNIGEGWYHYDVTPRKDGSTFFYITDAKMHEYSDNHNYTHRYDESLYPEIQ